MITWSLIDLIIGIGLIWYAINHMENIFIYYLMFIGGLFSFMMCYVHLSYLWGGEIWGDKKNELLNFDDQFLFENNQMVEPK